MNQYEKGREIGRGAFGAVYAARRRSDNAEVAIKRVHAGTGADGVDFTALREIVALSQCCHENVLRLYDVFAAKDKILLVMELMSLDLFKVISNKQFPLSVGYVKGYAVQMWRGLAHLHSLWLAHRDLKPANLLLHRSGVLKLGDLGLSRSWALEGEVLSPHVVTRQYRAPELLYGAPLYDAAAVDVWAAGCVMAELFNRAILFNGTSDIDQLSRIFALVGRPTEQVWPGVRMLPDFLDFDAGGETTISEAIPSASPAAQNLIKGTLTLRSAERLTAEQVLKNSWWTDEPLPIPPEKLLPPNLI